MIVVGSTVVTASESEIKTWDVGALMHIADTHDVTPETIMALPVGFALTNMVHPPTYLNKVVVSAESGALAVWNVATAKLKFVCDVFAGVAVTALVASPAVDILAGGLANGNVALHNIKTNKVLLAVIVCVRRVSLAGIGILWRAAACNSGRG